MREPALSSPITKMPNFASSARLYSRDKNEIITGLRRSERKPPPIYDSTRDFILLILEGKLNYDLAIKQAKNIPDETERRCALDVLRVTKEFLEKEQKGKLSPLEGMFIEFSDDSTIPISQLYVRILGNEQRLFYLCPWEKPLNETQLSVAGGIIRRAIPNFYPQYADCEIDFVSTHMDQIANKRTIRISNWSKITPLDSPQLDNVLSALRIAWREYRALPPRTIIRNRPRDLLSDLE